MQKDKVTMPRVLAFVVAASTALVSAAALAAPSPERVRGTVKAISSDTLTVHTAAGPDVSVALTGRTRYLEVTKSSLSHVDPGSYIGTATKSIGNKLVALEVVVFPPSMKGTGEGHYAWDRIADTTLSGSTTTASTMTNGTVSTAAPAGGAKLADSSMTNGTVSSAGAADGAKQITVTYKGGTQTVLVPPTAPIVTYQPGTRSDVTPGSYVFVNGVSQDGKVTANAVAVGVDGARPPM
ncbi:MAG TPA: hypothetical protein VE397_10160 [Stellaceae bacterium]|nr:hypothetical protein [Stellaceae bacterium]